MKTSPRPYLFPLLFLLLFAAVSLLVFHALWSPNAFLLSSDDNLGLLSTIRDSVQTSLFHPWTDTMLWGLPNTSLLFHPVHILLRLTSALFVNNAYHALTLALAAWFLALYLRSKSLSPPACLFGALVAFWTGTNLTLTYAGHIGKYTILLFLSASLWALSRWGRSSRPAWGILAASLAGVMFLAQGDVALFCTLMLLPPAAYEFLRIVRRPLRLTNCLRHLLPPALTALLVVLGATLTNLGTGVTDASSAQSPADHWAFITQWSQPPSESLDFIAPGWTGWRSGEPTGPYWGALGRDQNWDLTHHGFMNFKLENVYIGAIPVLFALLALLVLRKNSLLDTSTSRAATPSSAAPSSATAPDSPRLLIAIWAGTCLLALLLSFGKYVPLYKPFSLLPLIHDIRNPNKFIHSFQLALGVLAAFGLDTALRLPLRPRRLFALIAAALALLAALFWMGLWSASPTATAQLHNAGWPLPAAAAIQSTKTFAVFWCTLSLALAAALLFFFPHCGKKFSTVWKTLVFVPSLWLLAESAFILAPRYIQTMPPSYVADNPLTQHLKQSLGPNRTALLSQDSYNNLFLTFLFPFHHIPSVNVTQLPRPPADYATFWRTVQSPLRHWQLAAVSHVLAPAPLARQILADPSAAADFSPDFAFAVHPNNSDDGFTLQSLPLNSSAASDIILRLKTSWPRVAPVPLWREMDDNEALQFLAPPPSAPRSIVTLPPSSGIPPPPPAGAPLPTLSLLRCQPGLFEFSLTNSAPALIRIAEKFSPEWRAEIDGVPAPVLRCDYMFQAIHIPSPGPHRVLLRYAPSSLPLLLQGAGLFPGLIAALWLALSPFLSRAHRSTPPPAAP